MFQKPRRGALLSSGRHASGDGTATCALGVSIHGNEEHLERSDGHNVDWGRRALVLAQLRLRLCAEPTFEGALARALTDAIALHGAEFGTAQLPAENGLLLIVDQRGFKTPFLKAFREVRPTDGCACGRALRTRKPVVISDVTVDQEFRPFAAIARKAGYRAVETTPLFANADTLIAVVSTHFANVHTPTRIEMDTLIAYSQIVGEYLYGLLGNEDLSAKARSMHHALYERLRIGSTTSSIANDQPVGAN